MLEMEELAGRNGGKGRLGFINRLFLALDEQREGSALECVKK